jgi:hypothetical protein
MQDGGFHASSSLHEEGSLADCQSMLQQDGTSGLDDRIQRSILALEIRISGSFSHIGEFPDCLNERLRIGVLPLEIYIRP